MNSGGNLSEYIAEDYETKGRFCSYWHQINEVRNRMPAHEGRILIIGKGNGFIDNYLRQIGYEVETLDVDEELNPTYCASVLDMPLLSGSIDLVVCCQVLEHLPYDQLSVALGEIRRVMVTGGRFILSLPDLTRTYRFFMELPKIGELKFIVPIYIPEWLKKSWVFNGEHYWNIGNKGYPLKRIKNTIQSEKFDIEREFRVFEMSWHRFFILTAK